MGNTDKTKTNIWKLCKALKEIIGYYDFFGNIIKLLFIKYISTYPDKLPIYDMKDWKRLMEFSRVLDEARFGNNLVTPGDVKVAFDAVDKWKRNSNVHLSGAIDSMKFFFDPHQQRDILYILDSFTLSDNPEVMKLLFNDLIELGNNDVKLTGENTTNPTLRKLAVSLLEINENDSVLNSYCGFSTLLLNIDKVKKYAGYDLSANNVHVSLMMALMLGLKEHSINNNNFILVESEEKYSKAFVDGPLGTKIQDPYIEFKYGSLRDIEALGMYKTLEMLQDGGKAVFAVPGKILFSSSKGMVNLRKYFIEEGLKSVIALPPLWQGAGVPTNLVVLEKGYTGNIAMIEAKDFFEKPVRKPSALSEENQLKIVEMSNANINCDECAVVERNNPNLLDSWIPSSYITTEFTLSLRDIDEINQELEILYEELKSL